MARFHAEHRFEAAPGDVADVLFDPAFHRAVELPDLELLDVVDHVDDGGRARLALRYEYVGQLDPVARRLLAGGRLTWVQTLTLDRPTGRGRLDFAVEGHGDRLRGGADLTLADDGDGTVWELGGELKVRVPLVGGAAERRIVDGVLRRLDLQARKITERLAHR